MIKRILAIVLVAVLAVALFVPAGGGFGVGEIWEGQSITLNNGRRVFELYNEDSFWVSDYFAHPRIIAMEYFGTGGLTQEILLMGNAEHGELFSLDVSFGSRFFSYVLAIQETCGWSGLLFFDSELRRSIVPPQMVWWLGDVPNADSQGRAWVEPVPSLGDEPCGMLYYFYIAELYMGNITLRELGACNAAICPICNNPCTCCCDCSTSLNWVQLLLQILRLIIDWLLGLGS